ncbi:MAG: electron transfer flavoprotein subunit beta/FixA family protein [Syntrophobacteraceae bacterium]|nr:electron transfer flavoprotein subunit beta/FixA family protein [Syntrophobacteraceae bacterium]
MDIVVLIKQVPDSTEVKLDPKTGHLLREGIGSIMNPDDRHALEAAVRLKEAQGGKVVALSMGPAQAVDIVSEAIGMGADEGILLSDSAFAGADTWATSSTLGKAIEKIAKYDLVLCGRQAIDGDTAQIGPQVAEYLGLPQVTYACDIEAARDDGTIMVKKRGEGGYEMVQCPLPAVLTVIAEMNRTRYPAIGRLIDACAERAPVQIWNAADIGAKTGEVGLAGSLTHVIRTFAPKGGRRTEMLEGDTGTVVRTLLEKLQEKHLVLPGAQAGAVGQEGKKS